MGLVHLPWISLIFMVFMSPMDGMGKNLLLKKCWSSIIVISVFGGGNGSCQDSCSSLRGSTNTKQSPPRPNGLHDSSTTTGESCEGIFLQRNCVFLLEEVVNRCKCYSVPDFFLMASIHPFVWKSTLKYLTKRLRWRAVREEIRSRKMPTIAYLRDLPNGLQVGYHLTIYYPFVSVVYWVCVTPTNYTFSAETSEGNHVNRVTASSPLMVLLSSLFFNATRWALLVP